MEIRLAVEGDEVQVVELINDLIIELGGAPLPVDEATTTAAQFIGGGHEGAVIVASNDGDLVGVCTLTYQSSIRTLGKYAIIQEMYVAPKFRSAKLGEQLISKAKSLAENAGYPMIELSTPPDGERAESFYRNLGFTQVGVRMRYKFD
ncbi:GNAT family N-acetyltransferase [Candidatus Lucifugimonas marina]|jgi:ribosomal protein S18 acetylase RimI-like enzyme|uniref:GNAT family N-acetyltransferase n=1 Tax=Candidatus Lucifugimonas marina TaxID=3038979 RepID=A0AAJ5ZDE1_9CHLR|nr:GNAT family N-acetyltransferase [SAR202 cluster bacterium JH702]MDG0869442.1 GNAT family N-acetyltransferase [SAR202 cluster bacterium JH639]WFG34185.1 GNAT family N-acetyltransferase [SAR202 cluster bacterium JH545]WFG38114.1 GNAT family N-acetyltransferase [SAR202 cluster bacterium JH1073]